MSIECINGIVCPECGHLINPADGEEGEYYIDHPACMVAECPECNKLFDLLVVKTYRWITDKIN